MDKKLHETTNLCVEIMNGKKQVKGKLGQMVQIRICHLTLSMMLNLSNYGKIHNNEVSQYNNINI